MKSATHRWLGAGAVKFRSSRSGERAGAAGSAIVVRVGLARPPQSLALSAGQLARHLADVDVVRVEHLCQTGAEVRRALDAHSNRLPALAGPLE